MSIISFTNYETKHDQEYSGGGLNWFMAFLTDIRRLLQLWPRTASGVISRPFKPISEHGLLVISDNEEIIGYLRTTLHDWKLTFQPMAYLQQVHREKIHTTLSIVDMLEFDKNKHALGHLKYYIKTNPALVLLKRHGRSEESIKNARKEPETSRRNEELYDISELEPHVTGMILGPFARYDIEGTVKACVAKFNHFTLADSYLCIPAKRFGLTECGGTMGGYEGIPLSILNKYGEEWAIKSVDIADIAVIDHLTAVILMSKGYVSVWDLEKWKEKTRFAVRVDKGVAIAVIHRQIIVACSNVIIHLDIETGKQWTLLSNSDKRIFSMSFTENGNLLAIGYEDHSVEIFEFESMKSIAIIPRREKESLKCILISNLTNQIFISFKENPVIRLWNSRTGKYEKTLQGHEESVVAMCMSHDGKVLVSGSNKGELIFWNLNTGTGSVIYTGASKPISLQISLDSIHITCLFSDGILVQVYAISRIVEDRIIFKNKQKIATFYSEKNMIIGCNNSGLISRASCRAETEVVSAHISEFRY